MKTLTDYIIEKLDPAVVKKTDATRLKAKKTELVAVKKVLGAKSDDDLKTFVEAVYNGISDAKDSEEIFKKLDSGDVTGWKDIYDAITKANGNHPVSGDVILDILKKVANGMKLDAAIADAAKNL